MRRPGIVAVRLAGDDLSDDYDWKDISVQLSASNEKLCRIAIAADELAEAAAHLALTLSHMKVHAPHSFAKLNDALEAFKVVRQGQ